MNHFTPNRDLRRMEQDLAAARRSLAQLEGKREALRERGAILEREVGLAKGRLAIKGDVEKFIESMQSEAYQRSTHSIETLLTTLVKEVLPDARPIALDLSTERSMPALDISVVGKNDVREDIFQDHGGAINNVIGMGLRLIATMKSGSAKFLALDEPECWTKPDRVPAFFRVLEDASRRLGVQCVTITHHDAAANFDSSVRISKIVGHPDEGADIMSDAPRFDWTDELDGFRYIRLVNFQAFPDATMHLAPGVNAFVGPNDHGKSSVIRALRAVFYGETRDSLIRHGTKGAVVELGLARGRVLRFSRELKRNPRNKWSIHETDGTVVVENGTTYESGTAGANPPDWLDAMFGIKKQDKLDIHLAHQKFPVFLLDQTPSVRASVLSIGQESGYMRDMLAIQKERNTRDNATVKDGERELGLIRSTLTGYESLAAIAETLETAQNHLAVAEQWAQYIPFVQEEQRKLLSARGRLDQAIAATKVYSSLPSDEDLAAIRTALEVGILQTQTAETLSRVRRSLAKAIGAQGVLGELPETPVLSATDRLSLKLQSLRGARLGLDRAKARLSILSAIPSAPGLNPTAPHVERAGKLTLLRQQLTAARQKANQVGEQMDGVRRQLNEAIEHNGGQCPTCGHAVAVDDLLNAHVHAA